MKTKVTMKMIYVRILKTFKKMLMLTAFTRFFTPLLSHQDINKFILYTFHGSPNVELIIGFTWFFR